MIKQGRAFYKMSGSGNDFVFFDARSDAISELREAGVVQALSARGTGVGADGVVFLSDSSVGDVRMLYLNADGSRAMCGNATLCTTRLAVELGAASPESLEIETDSGLVRARIRNGKPEIDLPSPTVLTPRIDLDPQPGEQRAGFADTGVPHVVILCDDVETVDVVGRGRPLRYEKRFAAGTNVNFVSRGTGSWRMRTYERGVEAETLACGTGAVACAILLAQWGLASDETEIITRSGRPLTVRLARSDDQWRPSLSGDARIVYTGRLGES